MTFGEILILCVLVGVMWGIHMVMKSLLLIADMLIAIGEDTVERRGHEVPRGS